MIRALLLPVLMVSLAHAAEPLTPAEMVGRAIEAHGGAAGLEAWRNMSFSADATYFFGATEVPGTTDVHVRDAVMLRRKTQAEFRGNPFLFSSATTGKSAWSQRASRVYDMPLDNFVHWTAHRPDLLLKAMEEPAKLSAAGANQVDWEGLDSSVRFTFFPADGRLQAIEYKAMTQSQDLQKEEVFFKKEYADYRDTGGVPFPYSMTGYEKGARSSFLTVTAITLGEPPELALFAKPQADEESKAWGDQLAN